jgi:hypothetical protein
VFKRPKKRRPSVETAAAAAATATGAAPASTAAGSDAHSSKEEDELHARENSRPIDPTAFYIQSIHRAVRVSVVSAAAASATAAGSAVVLGGPSITHKFGTPLVFTLTPHTTKGRVRELMWTAVKRWLPKEQHPLFEQVCITDFCFHFVSNAALIEKRWFFDFQKPPYTIRILENMCIRCGVCNVDGCGGCELVGDANEPCGLSQKHALCVLWDKDEWVPALEQNMNDERVPRHASANAKDSAEVSLSFILLSLILLECRFIHSCVWVQMMVAGRGVTLRLPASVHEARSAGQR